MLFTLAVAATTSIGVVDTRVDARDGVVISRAFVPPGYEDASEPTADGRDHGTAVVDTVVDGFRKRDRDTPVRILHANIYVRGPDGALATSWPRALLALDWFKSEGVRFICTSFVSDYTKGAAAFVDRAVALGLTIVAPVSNPDARLSGLPYPASDARVIAVGSDDEIIRPRIARKIRALARVNMSPLAAGTTGKAVAGTSFAAARACGQMAARPTEKVKDNGR